MTTSPTNTTRQVSSVVAQPPTIGPTAMPGTGDAADHRVGGLAARALEVAGDQRRERGNTSAAPMPSSTDQPRARTATVCDTAVSAEPQA